MPGGIVMELSGYAYTCSAGETFDGVAAFLYDDEKYAAELLNANPEFADRLVFAGGESLYIPVIYIPDTAEEETVTEPERAPWRE